MRPRNLCLVLFLIGALVAPALSYARDKANSDAKKSEKKSTKVVKNRILSELIDTILREGRTRHIGEGVSANLGLGRTRTKVKAIQYDRKMSPDKKSHTMKVVFRKNKKGRLAASSIVWQITKFRRTKKGEHVDGMAFRFLPSGRLLNALTMKGMAGKTKHTKLSIKSRKVKKGFKQEMEYWLKDTAELTYLK